MQDHLTKHHNWSFEESSVLLKRKREQERIETAFDYMTAERGERCEKYELDAISECTFNIIFLDF